MHRRHLLGQLERYAGRYPEERSCVEQILQFVNDRPDCFLRSCVPGHITASAWVVSPERDKVLLCRHKKLDRWLQVGGHVDGEPEVYRAALREAQEESGIWDLRLWADGVPEHPLDVDVHEIPAYGDDPTHLHYDIRYLLVASDQEPRTSEESHEVRWFASGELEQATTEESVLRMARKAMAIA